MSRLPRSIRMTFVFGIPSQSIRNFAKTQDRGKWPPMTSSKVARNIPRPGRIRDDAFGYVAPVGMDVALGFQTRPDSARNSGAANLGRSRLFWRPEPAESRLRAGLPAPHRACATV
jgi:hypothetical protein